jgi:hypothetical protein
MKHGYFSMTLRPKDGENSGRLQVLQDWKNEGLSFSEFETVYMVLVNKVGIAHSEFVPQGQAVNQAFYLHVLQHCMNI